jgi:hypothetical protein
LIRRQTFTDNEDLLAFYRGLGDIPENEVVVLLARRAYCTYRAVVQDGILDPGTRRFGSNTFSSRILDWTLEWLGDHRTTVHLVDDSINRGAVFRRERQVLEDAGCTVVGHVFQPTIGHALDPAVHYHRAAASPAEVRSLSESVYKLIGESGYPYLLDFPLYRESAVTPEAIAALQAVGGWVTHDITNESHDSGMVRCLSLVPNDTGWRDLERELPGVSEVAELVKVRIYLRMAANRRWMVRILPKFTLRPHTSDVAAQVTQVLRDAMGQAPLRPLVGRDAGRFRLNQFLMSAALGSHFLRQLSQQTLASLDPAVDLDELRCQLGVRVADQDSLVGQAINSCTLASLSSLPRRFSEFRLPTEAVLGPGHELISLPIQALPRAAGPAHTLNQGDGWDFSASRASLPFLDLSSRFPPAANGDALYPALSLQRLLASWQALGIANAARDGAVILDLLSDRGIAVPVVRETHIGDQVVLARGYRYGENTSSALEGFAFREALETLCPGAGDSLLLALAALAAAGADEPAPELPAAEIAELARASGLRHGPEDVEATSALVLEAAEIVRTGGEDFLSDPDVQRAVLERFAATRPDRRRGGDQLRWTARVLLAKADGDLGRQSLASDRIPRWLRRVAVSNNHVWVNTSTTDQRDSDLAHEPAGIPTPEFASQRSATEQQIEAERRSLAWLSIGSRSRPKVSTLTIRNDANLIEGMNELLRTLFLQGLDASDIQQWMSSPSADLGADSPAAYVAANGVDDHVLSSARRALNLLGV